MALSKEKQLANGIVTNYHKIDSIYVDTENKKINVTINSYINENIRSIEKENQEKKLLSEELNDFIDKHIGTEDKEIEKQIIEKTNQYNELIESLIDTSTFVVDKNVYTLPYDTNISFEDIYSELKELDDFKNAKDIK